jgi:hypothetical protein
MPCPSLGLSAAEDGAGLVQMIAAGHVVPAPFRVGGVKDGAVDRRALGRR